MHRRRNFLVEVGVNGEWLSQDANIKEDISRDFHNLLLKVGDWRDRACLETNIENNFLIQ